MLPVDHFLRIAALHPNSVALVDGPLSMSYGELAARANALGAALQAIDANPQSRVGICAYNTLQHLIALLATYVAGKIWIPLNPRNGTPELTRIIAATRPTIIFADSDCLGKIDTKEATLILGKQSGVVADDLTTMADLLTQYEGQNPTRPNLGPDDIQAIKFTGGSSGTPKGCIQTYRVYNTCIASMVKAFEFNQSDRNLLAAPMTHGTNTLILPIFAQGGSQAFMGPSKPAAIIEAMEQTRTTTCFLPPTVIYMMMAEPGLEAHDLSSLRHLLVGGAAMRVSEIPKAMKLFNNALETAYGQTEAPQIATYMSSKDWQDERNFASIGRATHLTEVGIMDADGNPVTTGESGEIVLKGDLVMQGYLDMPEVTAQTIKHGWLHTGDIGIIDERGFIFIKDRIRDVIITGGFNVYPSDIEAVVGAHESVRECVVFGVEDDKWGEAVHAAVELHDGEKEDAAGIIALVKQQLDSVKAPKVIHFSDALPRSPVGKVLRREAKRIYSTT